MIPQRCIYIVTSQNLSSLHSFLHNSPIKKVVFDSRDLADCLFRQYNLTLENVMDLQIIELALRGQVNSRVALPMKAIQKDGQIAKVVLKDRLLTMTECSRHYLDDKVVGLENEILVVEYFCNHFSFLLEFGDVIFNGNRSDMMQYSDPRSTTVPHDYIYFGTISHRHSKINSGKSHRDNSKYDTHNFVYSHVVEKFPVLCVVECGLCHVTQPVDSYSNEELYSNQHVCKTCSAIRELHDKNEETSVKRMKWSCF